MISNAKNLCYLSLPEEGCVRSVLRRACSVRQQGSRTEGAKSSKPVLNFSDTVSSPPPTREPPDGASVTGTRPPRLLCLNIYNVSGGVPQAASGRRLCFGRGAVCFEVLWCVVKLVYVRPRELHEARGELGRGTITAAADTSTCGPGHTRCLTPRHRAGVTRRRGPVSAWSWSGGVYFLASTPASLHRNSTTSISSTATSTQSGLPDSFISAQFCPVPRRRSVICAAEDFLKLVFSAFPADTLDQCSSWPPLHRGQRRPTRAIFTAWPSPFLPSLPSTIRLPDQPILDGNIESWTFSERHLNSNPQQEVFSWSGLTPDCRSGVND
ncbi:hypothetical protein E2C01_032158 [Portunus trituberculatus]|uniref:Uncharacterized protein n=1 Tax=Portunus trituberculatus TaxID=210409 RepID=A0A5B7EZL2_PORTR|nr:hypothetical protein [Portunus trituberculatus]